MIGSLARLGPIPKRACELASARRYTVLRLACIASLAVVGACGDQKAPIGPPLEFTIAPLNLPGLGIACYDVKVETANDTVWSHGNPLLTRLGHNQASPPDGALAATPPIDTTTVCSDQFGNGPGGGITYIGTCDASPDADTVAGGIVQNKVTVWVDGLYNLAGTAELGDWQDPCPNGCSLQVDCEQDTDSRVTFNLTVMRNANQGFFDIAVDFEDIFCSAKFDTCYAGEDPEPIRLIFGAGPDRDWTGVFGFACTAGTDATLTTLLYSIIQVDCGSAGLFLIDPTQGPGNAKVTVGTKTLHYGVYNGLEQLDCGSGPGSCKKAYWNLAFSLDDLRALNTTCTLSLSATANDNNTGFTAGLPTASGLTHPYIDLHAVLTTPAPAPATTGVATCETRPLDGGAVVTTVYKGSVDGVPTPAVMCWQYNGAAGPTDAVTGCGTSSVPGPPGFTLIPAGGFIMGSPLDEANRISNEPQHEVFLTRAFWIQETEVTQRQWLAAFEDNPSHFQGMDRPVEKVSWWDSIAYANSLSDDDGLEHCYQMWGCRGTPGAGTWPGSCTTCGTEETFQCDTWWFAGPGCEGYRLPTEAEWEYAARAGTTGAHYNVPGPMGDIAWYNGNSGGQSQNVAQKPANAWGLHDMLGNVWERMTTRLYDYPVGPVTDPLGPPGPGPGNSHQIRGASWYFAAAHVRAATRNVASGVDRYSALGFRLVRSASGLGVTLPAAPAGLLYATNPAAYFVDWTIDANTLTSTGGEIAWYSIEPALPTGLDFAPLTGRISGTPQATSPATEYIVTGFNAAGSTSVALSIGVSVSLVTNCCSAHAGKGCNDATCQTTICTADPYCCNVQWDETCTGEALRVCAVCL